MQKLLVISFMLLVFTGYGIAQSNIYTTRNATFQVTGKYMENILIGQSKEMYVSLDYETTEMILRFDLNTIELNIDTLNSMLKSENDEFVFFGKLSLDFINTKGHPPLKFTVDGWIERGIDKIMINGEGELFHINDSGDYVCMLSLTTTINLKKLDIKIPPGLHEEVHISITQALLENRKN